MERNGQISSRTFSCSRNVRVVPLVTPFALLRNATGVGGSSFPSPPSVSPAADGRREFMGVTFVSVLTCSLEPTFDGPGVLGAPDEFPRKGRCSSRGGVWNELESMLPRDISGSVASSIGLDSKPTPQGKEGSSKQRQTTRTRPRDTPGLRPPRYYF